MDFQAPHAIRSETPRRPFFQPSVLCSPSFFSPVLSPLRSPFLLAHICERRTYAHARRLYTTSTRSVISSFDFSSRDDARRVSWPAVEPSISLCLQRVARMERDGRLASREARSRTYPWIDGRRRGKPTKKQEKKKKNSANDAFAINTDAFD